MSGQKKSGNRGSQRESPISKKNATLIESYLYDLRKDGTVEDVYVARILRKFGNGRMEVFYIKNGLASLANASIRGLFRGKGKHSVNIDINSIVLISDASIPGTSQFEIVGLFTPDHIYALRKATNLDNRILAAETDEGALMRGEGIDLGGFDIVGGEVTDDEDDNDELNIDTI